MVNPVPLRPEQRTLQARVDREIGALMVLARRWPQYEGDLSRAFQTLTQSVAVALEVERASIWLLDAEGRTMVCRDLYEASRHRHSRGYRVVRDEAESYFSALQTEGWIQAVDAHSDPRTAPFAGNYLVPHGIGALSDLPIRVGGRVAGVVRAEHVGGPRTFQTDELTSQSFIASLASLALESERAEHAQASLSDERSLLAAALDASGAAVMVLDESGSVRFYNDRLLSLWGLSPEMMGPAGSNGVRIQRIADQTEDPARFIARFRRISADADEQSRDFVTTKDGRAIERASAPHTLADGSAARVWSFRVVSGAAG